MAAVGKYFYAEKNRWQIHWRVSVGGKSTPRNLYLPCVSLGGERGACERVAERLRVEVAMSGDKKDVSIFWEIRDRLIAEELQQHVCGADAASGASASRDCSEAAVSPSGAASPTVVGNWGICPILVPSDAEICPPLGLFFVGSRFGA